MRYIQIYRKSPTDEYEVLKVDKTPDGDKETYVVRI
jgi:hypothetical protein